MIAFDTNVLMRYLVEDDAAQTALAAALIDRVIAADYLIREHACATDCESVATFDTVLVKERGFVAVR